MPRGGMRYGAGRPGWHRKAEVSLSLDVRRLARMDCLRPGTSYGWTWRDGYGDVVGNARITVPDTCRVLLSYRWTPYGGESQHVCCNVPLCRTPCNYGASRVWFRCPRCDQRCALIYFGAPGGQYGCRRCSRVAYTSQSETRIDRLHRKLQKLENRMAGGVEHWDWRRPKGMHQITYERTVERYLAIVEAQDLEIEHRLTRMFPTSIW